MPLRRYYRSPLWGTGEMVELKDDSRASIKRGDIVLLSDAKSIPKYARDRFCVVISRYRTSKRLNYGSRTYYNYGVELMLLDGPRKGKTLRLMSIVGGHMKEVH